MMPYIEFPLMLFSSLSSQFVSHVFQIFAFILLLIQFFFSRENTCFFMALKGIKLDKTRRGWA